MDNKDIEMVTDSYEDDIYESQHIGNDVEKEEKEMVDADKAIDDGGCKGKKNKRQDTYYSNNFFPHSSESGKTEICVVGMKRGETISFQGYVLVSPIYGDSIIMGYRLRSDAVLGRDIVEPVQIESNKELVFYPLFSPKTHALVCIESVERKNEETSRISHSGIKTSPEITKIINNLLSELNSVKEVFDTILAFRDMSWCGIKGVESVAQPFFKRIFSVESTIEKQNHFNIIGFHPIFDVTPDIVSLDIPESWKNAAYQLTVDTTEYSIPPVSIICGHQNVGKSTFSRYLINSLFNVCPKVAYVESDIGQPEFTPSGLVSLNILDSPIFGPSFTHIQQPYRSYFLGHTTPRDDPDYYLNCLRELIIVYRRDISCGPNFGMYADDKTPYIPLVINTHGWVREGMGYDLFIHLLGIIKPTHIVQLYSSTNTHKNIRSLPNHVISPPNEDPPKMIFVEIVNSKKISTKYKSSDYRMLSLLSYFYSNAVALTQKQDNVKWWKYDKPLIHQVPWCLDWTKGLSKGVFLFFEDVPWSQLLYALNGSLVALIGDAPGFGGDGQEIPQGKKDEKIQPPLYFPCPDYPSPPPSEHSCIGLAIIRSIDPTTHTFHILTPLSYDKLQYVNAMVKGKLELPIWFRLDHTKNNSTGVCGVPWKHLPYMSFEAGLGVGNEAQRVRKKGVKRDSVKE
ncbi:18612_t:CDS:2 [Acaulospora morrowiae]|uniref:Polynucleotide 5'-hydroxyl-kinase GRC3 n=1 Tax=Acaulospora morrowiae TaxID=94023 RepID=A0A9N9F283_9GLOM|nr:18612_t:CDS:2 [Acaulospora morrowiae]